MAVSLDRIADVMQSAPNAVLEPAFPQGIDQPLRLERTPVWRFWLLSGLAAVFAVVGALFLTLSLVG